MQEKNSRISVLERDFNLLEGTEREALREEYAKHFDLGAGRFQAVEFAEPVHYRDAQGKYREIDNTLVPQTVDGCLVYRTADNPLEAQFPAEAGSVSVSFNGKRLSWGFEEPVEPVQVQLKDGSALLRAELIRRAEIFKASAIQRSPASLDAQGTVSFSDDQASEPEPASIASPGLDSGALAEILKAKDLESVALATLDTALRTPYERRASRVEKQTELYYSHLLPGVSVRYRLADGHIKEDIIADNERALDRIAIRLPDSFRYEVDSRQRVLVRDPDSDDTCFIFNPPFVYDASGNSQIAQVELEKADGYWRMRYVLPAEFLNDATYPVTIDPVVKTGYKDSSAIEDAYIWENNKSVNYGGAYIMRCGFGVGGESVSLIRFKQLIKQRASDTILSAYMRLCPENYGGNAEYFACYPIKTDWNINTVTWNSMTPENDNHISSDILSYIANTYYLEEFFDITNLCRDWYKKDANGNSRNFGVAVRYPQGVSTSDTYVEWTACNGLQSYCPQLVVNYVSHAGLEAWWQYETLSAGRAGTAHVDIYNGNMVFAHPDVSMSGNLLPVSVSHYYNSCTSEKNDCFCGMGWRTSMHLSVHKEVLGGKTYYVWTDGDGTQHYFEVSGSAPYKDCEGMELKFNVSGGLVTITDKGHSVMSFPEPTDTTPCFISNLRDAHYTENNGTRVTGSEMSFAYVAGRNGMIDTITDGAGRVTQYSYAGDLLTEIEAPDGTSVSFAYDNANRLTGVTYSDLPSTSGTLFTYETASNLLIAARNYDGVSVQLGFEPEASFDVACIENFAAQARKVISLELTGGNLPGGTVVGGVKKLIEYLNMTTRVTSMKDNLDGKTITYQFNDAGNVTCMFDELGFAQSAQFSSSLPNTAEKVSRLQKAVINLVPNLDFSAGWTASGSGASRDADIRCLSMPSLKMLNAAATETVYQIAVPCHGAGTHTFSVYIKASGLTRGGAFARLKAGDTAYSSRKVSGSTQNATGGPAAEGWERVFVSADLTAADTVQLELVCDARFGTAWFACPQLEEGSIPNHVNLLVNADYSNTVDNTAVSGYTRQYPVSWTPGVNVANNRLNEVVTTGHNLPVGLKGNALRLLSFPGTDSITFQQSLDVKGSKDDNFVFGGWVNAQSTAKIPTEPDRKNVPCICYRFNNGNTYGSWIRLEFSREWVGWQFGCWPVAAPTDYTRIDFQVLYSMNAQTAMFSNMFVYREQYGPSFAYDSDKNLISTANLAEKKSAMEYDTADNLISYVQPGAADTDKYTFDYGEGDEQKKHLLKSSKTPMGIEQNFSYDARGNATLAATVGTIGETDSAIKSQTFYTAEDDETPLPNGVNENYVRRTYDARGKAVTRTVNPQTYLLDSVEDPDGQTVEYTYDAAKRVTGVETTVNPNTANSKTYRNAYTYENDRIRTVAHNTTGDACDVGYTFEYDALGRKTNVKVGNPTENAEPTLLSHNEYSDDHSGLLTEVAYGNGGKVAYEYDDFDRLTGVKYDDDSLPRYTYEYGANGQVSFMEDANLEQSKQVEYDLAERPCQVTIRDTSVSDPEADNLLYRTTLSYDVMNRLEAFGEQTQAGTHRTAYSYDKDNRVTQIRFDGDARAVEYEYDALGRLAKRTAKQGNSEQETEYEYVAGDAQRYGAGATTALVRRIDHGSAGSYEYTYDDRGNILTETHGGLTIRYAYDALGQLIRVDDPGDMTAGANGTTWTYEYDLGGNILCKKYYACTTGALPETALRTYPYVYGNSHWKDQLTSYDGKAITYDAIGNPLNDGERTYTWGAGRQLRSVTMAAKEEEMMVSDGGTVPGGCMKLTIGFSRVNLIESSSDTVTLTAHVWDGETEITDRFAASCFDWVRNSGRTSGDAAWANSHRGMKQVTIVQSDMNGDIDVECVFTPGSGTFGQVTVDDSLMASHTQGTANDVFSLVNGTLMVNDVQGIYGLEEGHVIAHSNVKVSAKVFTEAPNKVLSFKYNADGLRTKKTVTLLGKVTETEYILHGKLVTEMIVRKYDAANPTDITTTDTLHFFYDAQSRPAMVKHNGITYRYLHNLQGDIVAILDSNGNDVVEYRYDAWGNHLSTVCTLTTKLATLNPFRYRGYVYDEETGLYYLRSRYYNPALQLFVNADSLLRNNVYVYCRNTPILRHDFSGTESVIVPLPSRPMDWNSDYLKEEKQQMVARRLKEALESITDFITQAPKTISDTIYALKANSIASHSGGKVVLDTGDTISFYKQEYLDKSESSAVRRALLVESGIGYFFGFINHPIVKSVVNYIGGAKLSIDVYNKAKRSMQEYYSSELGSMGWVEFKVSRPITDSLLDDGELIMRPWQDGTFNGFDYFGRIKSVDIFE